MKTLAQVFSILLWFGVPLFAADRTADLKPVDIALEVTGEGARWTVSVLNQGNAPAPKIPYRLLLDGKVIQEKTLLEPLEAGAVKSIIFLDRRPLEAGKHRLACLLDPEAQVADADTSNNLYEVNWQPVAAAKFADAKSDFEIRAVSIEPQQAQVGTPLRVFFQVYNSSEIELYRVPVSLSVDGSVVAEKTFFQKLAPQTEADLSLPWVPTEAGDHRLTLHCQGQSSPPQSFQVAARPGYKLQLLSATVPKRSRQDKDWVIEVTIKNQGSLAAEAVKAVLWVDGSRAWSGRLSEGLKPDQQATIPLRWSALQAGQRQLRIELTAQGAKSDEKSDVNQTYQVEVEPNP